MRGGKEEIRGKRQNDISSLMFEIPPLRSFIQKWGFVHAAVTVILTSLTDASRKIA